MRFWGIVTVVLTCLCVGGPLTLATDAHGEHHHSKKTLACDGGNDVIVASFVLPHTPSTPGGTATPDPPGDSKQSTSPTYASAVARGVRLLATHFAHDGSDATVNTVPYDETVLFKRACTVQQHSDEVAGQRSGCVWGTRRGHFPRPDQPAWLVFDLGHEVGVRRVTLWYTDKFNAGVCPQGVQIQSSASANGPWDTVMSLAGVCTVRRTLTPHGNVGGGGGGGGRGALSAFLQPDAELVELPLPDGYTGRYWKVSVSALSDEGDGVPVIRAVDFVGCDACSQPCAPGTFLQTPCSGDHPRTCAPCSTPQDCPAGWFVRASCTPLMDQQCVRCDELCGDGSYSLGACTSAHDVQCAPCSTFKLNGGAKTPPSACRAFTSGPLPSSRRAVLECGGSEYLECVDSDCACAACTVCAVGQVTLTECAANTDTVCQVGTPIAFPSWGAGQTSVTIESSTPAAGVSLAWTLDGTEPQCGNAVAGRRHIVAVATTSTVKAMACHDTLTPSPVGVQEVYVADSSQEMLGAAVMIKNVAPTSIHAVQLASLRSILASTLSVPTQRVVVTTIRAAEDGDASTSLDFAVALSSRDGMQAVNGDDVNDALFQRLGDAQPHIAALFAASASDTTTGALQLMDAPSMYAMSVQASRRDVEYKDLLDMHMVLLLACVVWSVSMCARSTCQCCRHGAFGGNQPKPQVGPQVHPATAGG